MSHRVVILHTNDFHNHLTAEQAETLRRAKADAGGNAMLVDAGDAILAGNIGVRPGGEPILSLMSDVGYDCMTLGNREFHISESVMRHKIALAKFPILCANIRFRSPDSRTHRGLPTVRFIMRTVAAGVRIGVIGVTVPMVTERMSARHVSAFVFDDPVATLANLALELRPQVDVLIGLTHIGIKADERASECCGALDLLITGHTHLTLEAGDRGAAVPIVQTGSFGHLYGRVEFEVGAARPKLVAAEIRPLDPVKC